MHMTIMYFSILSVFNAKSVLVIEHNYVVTLKKIQEIIQVTGIESVTILPYSQATLIVELHVGGSM